MSEPIKETPVAPAAAPPTDGPVDENGQPLSKGEIKRRAKEAESASLCHGSMVLESRDG